jgi:hypothetical protein
MTAPTTAPVPPRTFRATALSVALLAFAALTPLTAGGCASYVTPGRGAKMEAFGVRKDDQTDGAVVQSLGKRPLASFPAGVAVARVQAPGYRSETADSWGRGRYSIVTTRDVEGDATSERLAKLPLVAGVVPISRLLLPEQLNSDLELRQAAAQLHADVLLVYTLDTTFRVEDSLAPLTVVTLGLSPNQHARVVCTASAVLMDTRNGFVYGAAEATQQGSQLASAWTSAAAVDDARRRTETQAFDKLVGEVEKTWVGVIRTYAAPAAPVGPAVVPGGG